MYLIGQCLDHNPNDAGICVPDRGTFLRYAEEAGNDVQETVEIDGEDYLLAQ